MIVNKLKPESIARFDDVRNYTYGYGRLIWAEAALTNDGMLHPPGWVLPGGERTNDIEKAAAVAKWIDSIYRKELWIRI